MPQTKKVAAGKHPRDTPDTVEKGKRGGSKAKVSTPKISKAKSARAQAALAARQLQLLKKNEGKGGSSAKKPGEVVAGKSGLKKGSSDKAVASGTTLVDENGGSSAKKPGEVVAGKGGSKKGSSDKAVASGTTLVDDCVEHSKEIGGTKLAAKKNVKGKSAAKRSPAKKVTKKVGMVSKTKIVPPKPLGEKSASQKKATVSKLEVNRGLELSRAKSLKSQNLTGVFESVVEDDVRSKEKKAERAKQNSHNSKAGSVSPDIHRDQGDLVGSDEAENGLENATTLEEVGRKAKAGTDMEEVDDGPEGGSTLEEEGGQDKAGTVGKLVGQEAEKQADMDTTPGVGKTTKDVDEKMTQAESPKNAKATIDAIPWTPMAVTDGDSPSKRPMSSPRKLLRPSLDFEGEDLEEVFRVLLVDVGDNSATKLKDYFDMLGKIDMIMVTEHMIEKVLRRRLGIPVGSVIRISTEGWTNSSAWKYALLLGKRKSDALPNGCWGVVEHPDMYDSTFFFSLMALAQNVCGGILGPLINMIRYRITKKDDEDSQKCWLNPDDMLQLSLVEILFPDFSPRVHFFPKPGSEHKPGQFTAIPSIMPEYRTVQDGTMRQLNIQGMNRVGDWLTCPIAFNGLLANMMRGSSINHRAIQTKFVMEITSEPKETVQYHNVTVSMAVTRHFNISREVSEDSGIRGICVRNGQEGDFVNPPNISWPLAVDIDPQDKALERKDYEEKNKEHLAYFGLLRDRLTLLKQEIDNKAFVCVGRSKDHYVPQNIVDIMRLKYPGKTAFLEELSPGEHLNFMFAEIKVALARLCRDVWENCRPRMDKFACDLFPIIRDQSTCVIFNEAVHVITERLEEPDMISGVERDKLTRLVLHFVRVMILRHKIFDMKSEGNHRMASLSLYLGALEHDFPSFQEDVYVPLENLFTPYTAYYMLVPVVPAQNALFLKSLNNYSRSIQDEKANFTTTYLKDFLAEVLDKIAMDPAHFFSLLVPLHCDTAYHPEICVPPDCASVMGSLESEEEVERYGPMFATMRKIWTHHRPKNLTKFLHVYSYLASLRNEVDDGVWFEAKGYSICRQVTVVEFVLQRILLSDNPIATDILSALQHNLWVRETGEALVRLKKAQLYKLLERIVTRSLMQPGTLNIVKIRANVSRISLDLMSWVWFISLTIHDISSLKVLKGYLLNIELHQFGRTIYQQGLKDAPYAWISTKHVVPFMELPQYETTNNDLLFFWKAFLLPGNTWMAALHDKFLSRRNKTHPSGRSFSRTLFCTYYRPKINIEIIGVHREIGYISLPDFCMLPGLKAALKLWVGGKEVLPMLDDDALFDGEGEKDGGVATGQSAESGDVIPDQVNQQPASFNWGDDINGALVEQTGKIYSNFDMLVDFFFQDIWVILRPLPYCQDIFDKFNPKQPDRQRVPSTISALDHDLRFTVDMKLLSAYLTDMKKCVHGWKSREHVEVLVSRPHLTEKPYPTLETLKLVYEHVGSPRGYTNYSCADLVVVEENTKKVDGAAVFRGMTHHQQALLKSKKLESAGSVKREFTIAEAMVDCFRVVPMTQVGILCPLLCYSLMKNVNHGLEERQRYFNSIPLLSRVAIDPGSSLSRTEKIRLEMFLPPPRNKSGAVPTTPIADMQPKEQQMLLSQITEDQLIRLTREERQILMSQYSSEEQRRLYSDVRDDIQRRALEEEMMALGDDMPTPPPLPPRVTTVGEDSDDEENQRREEKGSSREWVSQQTTASDGQEAVAVAQLVQAVPVPDSDLVSPSVMAKLKRYCKKFMLRSQNQAGNATGASASAVAATPLGSAQPGKTDDVQGMGKSDKMVEDGTSLSGIEDSRVDETHLLDSSGLPDSDPPNQGDAESIGGSGVMDKSDKDLATPAGGSSELPHVDSPDADASQLEGAGGMDNPDSDAEEDSKPAAVDPPSPVRRSDRAKKSVDLFQPEIFSSSKKRPARTSPKPKPGVVKKAKTPEDNGGAEEGGSSSASTVSDEDADSGTAEDDESKDSSYMEGVAKKSVKRKRSSQSKVRKRLARKAPPSNVGNEDKEGSDDEDAVMAEIIPQRIFPKLAARPQYELGPDKELRNYEEMPSPEEEDEQSAMIDQHDLVAHVDVMLREYIAGTERKAGGKLSIQALKDVFENIQLAMGAASNLAAMELAKLQEWPDNTAMEQVDHLTRVNDCLLRQHNGPYNPEKVGLISKSAMQDSVVSIPLDDCGVLLRDFPNKYVNLMDLPPNEYYLDIEHEAAYERMAKKYESGFLVCIRAQLEQQTQRYRLVCRERHKLKFLNNAQLMDHGSWNMLGGVDYASPNSHQASVMQSYHTVGKKFKGKSKGYEHLASELFLQEQGERVFELWSKLRKACLNQKSHDPGFYTMLLNCDNGDPISFICSDKEEMLEGEPLEIENGDMNQEGNNAGAGASPDKVTMEDDSVKGKSSFQDRLDTCMEIETIGPSMPVAPPAHAAVEAVFAGTSPVVLPPGFDSGNAMSDGS